MRRSTRLVAICAAAGICAVPKAQAQAAAPTQSSIWTRSDLLGAIDAFRPALAVAGVSLGLQDSETLLGNLTGGIKQGATMQGLATATLQIDMGKIFGLHGGTFYASALQIHGRSLSPYYLDNLQTANGNEATNSTRLWELWYDQRIDQNAFDIRIGQQSLDQEFIVSQSSGLFVNTMAGWPLVPSADLYAGGPAYPLSSLGIRLRFHPAKSMAVLAGVYNDNPPGGPFDNDPQSLDGGGIKFNLNTGALFIAEFQMTKQFGGLPGTYKLGFWYDTASFPDQQFDDQGVSLASPASDGIAAQRKGNFSPYLVLDQTIWQPNDGPRSLNFFVRMMGAPPDRNLISFSANFGLTLTDPLPGRDQDGAGINFGIGHVSSAAAALDRATGSYTNTNYPVRATETLVELTYQAQIAPWLQIQPDLQMVFNPGAGIPDPAQPSHLLGNEVIAGVRANVTF